MKKLTKTIMLSALAAVAFGGLAVGSTYALFTSEAETKLTVTSGKVAVKAEIQNLKLYSLDEESGEVVSLDSQSEFTNGGTASIKDTNLVLSNITPGDKVEFELKVTNESTVDIKYRNYIKAVNDNGLFAGLKVTIDDVEYDGSTKVGEYVTWAKDAAEKTVVMKVSVELPVDAGNVYQGKSSGISFKVQAIQKNAKVEKADEDTYPIYEPSDLVNFADKVTAGTLGYNKAKLMNDIDMAGVAYASPTLLETDFDFDGAGYTIKNFTPSFNEDYEAGLFADVDKGIVKIHDIKFENATVVAESMIDDDATGAYNKAGVVVGYAHSWSTLPTTNFLTIENIEVDSSKVEVAKYSGAIVGYSSSNYDSLLIKNVKINDTNVTGYAAGGVMGQLGEGQASIDGVEGKGNTVTAISKEGGLVGAHSGDFELTINYDEDKFSVAISDTAEKSRGNVVGYNGEKPTIVNGAQYLTVMEADVNAKTTMKLADITSKLATDKLNIIELAPGSYDPETSAVSFTSATNGVKLVGRGEAKWNQKNGYQFNGVDLTMENITVYSSVASSYYQGFPHAKSATFDNCKFTVNSGEGVIGYWGDGAVKFTECDFEVAAGRNEHNLYLYGGTSFEFTKCNFTSDKGAIKCYKEKAGVAQDVNVTVKDCVFNSVRAEKAKTYYTAVTVSNDYEGDLIHWNIVIDNITATGNYSDGLITDMPGVFGIDSDAKFVKSNVSLTLNGVEQDLGLSE